MWIRTQEHFFNTDDYDDISVELEMVSFTKHIGGDNEAVQIIDIENYYYEVVQKVLNEKKWDGERLQRWGCWIASKLYFYITDSIMNRTTDRIEITDSLIETIMRDCVSEEEKELAEL